MGRRASDDSNKAVEYVMSGALPSEALEKYVVLPAHHRRNPKISNNPSCEQPYVKI